MRSFKEQWRDFPRKRELQVSLAALVIGGAWMAGAYTRPPAEVPTPKIFVCVNGIAEMTTGLTGVTEVHRRDEMYYLHTKFGIVPYMQAHGEACFTRLFTYEEYKKYFYRPSDTVVATPRPEWS